MDDNSLANELRKRKDDGSLRELKLSKNLIDFASNDYLGLARSETLLKNIQKKWEEWNRVSLLKLGSTGSRLLTGHSDYHEALEEKIATFHKAESALLFSSGFLANMGLLSSIAHRKDAILYDSHVHASLKMGIHLSGARKFPWKHQNLGVLEEKLKKSQFCRFRYVVVESIYSCDGSFSLLKEISQLCDTYHAFLIVDEAHATGILGEYGEGAVVAARLEKKVFARMHSFSKALGIQGAAIVGNQLLKSYLLNHCLSQIYTTAPAFPLLAAIDCAYDCMKSSTEQRKQLFHLIQFFRQAIRQREGFIESSSPIQGYLMKGNFPILKAMKKLNKAGIDVRALRAPTVPNGQERLRIVLHAFNSLEQIEILLENL